MVGEKMRFSVNEYNKIFLEIPLLCAIIALIMCVDVIKKIPMLFSDNEDRNQVLFKLVFHLVIVGLGVFQTTSPLVQGGYWLFIEDDSSKVTHSGMITAIEETGKYEFELWIDNQKYIIIDCGEFAVGDEVQVEYLPNSRYVLSLELK